VVYYHGGGYFSGNLGVYWHPIEYLVRDFECPILFVDYRLAPEFPLPAGHEDGYKTYEYLLSLGIESQHVAFMGDSAGGGIALTVLQRCRDIGTPLPCAVCLLSPWLDLTFTGESHVTMAKHDGMLNPLCFNRQLSGFLTNWKIALEDPIVSPLFGSFKLLPPTFYVVGSNECLLSDSIRAFSKSHNAGVKSKLEIVPYMFHVFPLFGDMPEAFNVRQSMKRFLQEYGF